MRAPFVIDDKTITAGSRVSLDLPLPHQSTYTPMTMPVHVVHGKRNGPVLFVSAAIHGDEINGVEIIRLLLRHRALKYIKGTLICVPIVNVFGFVTHSRYLPDRRDLNRSFPGTRRGSLASRLAYRFTEEIVKKSSHGIDLHTGALHRTNHPHIRADLDDPATSELARAFGTPVIINANLRDGSLRQVATEMGIPMLLYEAGEGLRFDTLGIRAGLRGILNVMSTLGMIRKRRAGGAKAGVVEARSSTWLRAPQSGILRVAVKIGARVELGDVIGYIADALGDNERAVVSSATGIVIGRTNLPVVNEGDALFHIARFSNSRTVADAIETFHEEHIEGLGPGDYIEETPV